MRKGIRGKLIAIATLAMLSLSVSSSAVLPITANPGLARLSRDVSAITGQLVEDQLQEPAAAEPPMLVAIFALGALIARRRTRLR
jgi:hypothetical protein